MTRLVNDPQLFAGEALAGYAAAEPDRVLAVRGGVVRAAASPPGSVAIVMGGGSGHFPAFAGWVGPGLGHGAACGNVFASPSEGQILSVARAAHAGGGILFAPINYAGDILHFGAAAETLRAEGLDVRLAAITDDIASGPPDDRASRRGIAGSFIVLKIAGAAAERGATLDEVERILIAANDATRTFGAAFSGCTLPGASEPLFRVAPGRVALGLGIHGEPGTSEAPLDSADQVADLLVDGLFAERTPHVGDRVAVVVNGLGATKYDELFVVFARVRLRLEEAGATVVAPVVGEQVTSLDMAGVSVSICLLDDELESLWTAPADVFSFSRGTVAPAGGRRAEVGAAPPPSDVAAGSSDSRTAAAAIAAALARAAAAIADAQGELGRIDAIAGDGDHGAGMTRGADAAAAAAAAVVARSGGAGTTLRAAGEAWSDAGGGASGALWGSGLRAAAEVTGDSAPVTSAVAARAVRAFADAVVERGGAEPGDKTMVDAILPFAAELEARATAGEDFTVAWAAAAASASAAAAATASLEPRRGRSRLHVARSIGTPDAGAVSFALVVESVREAHR